MGINLIIALLFRLIFYIKYKNMRFITLFVIVYFYSCLLIGQTINDFYDKGKSFLSAGKYEQAISEFTKVVKEDSYYFEAYHDRGLAYYKLKKYDKAADDFSAAIKAKKDYFLAYTNRAKAYLAMNDEKKAVNDLEQILKMNPNYIQAHEVLAEIRFKNKDYKNALKSVEKVIAKQTKNADMYYYRAVIAQNNNEPIVNILKYLKKGIDIDAKHVLSLNLRANIYMESKDYPKAVSDLDVLLKLKPENKEEILPKLALAAFTSGMWDKSIKAYSELLDKLHKRDIHYNLNRGIAYMKSGDNKSAMRDFNKVVSLDRKNEVKHIAHYNRAIIYGKEGKDVQAIREFSKAIELDTKSFEAYYERGLYYFEKQKFDEAIKDLDECIKLNPSPDAYYIRGAAYYQAGKRTKACEDLNKAASMGHPKAKKEKSKFCL